MIYMLFCVNKFTFDHLHPGWGKRNLHSGWPQT